MLTIRDYPNAEASDMLKISIEKHSDGENISSKRDHCTGTNRFEMEFPQQDTSERKEFIVHIKSTLSVIWMETFWRRNVDFLCRT